MPKSSTTSSATWTHCTPLVVHAGYDLDLAAAYDIGQVVPEIRQDSRVSMSLRIRIAKAITLAAKAKRQVMRKVIVRPTLDRWTWIEVVRSCFFHLLQDIE